jgi:cytochrome c-type biogenesis protein CcmH/NrfG
LISNSAESLAVLQESLEQMTEELRGWVVLGGNYMSRPEITLHKKGVLK